MKPPVFEYTAVASVEEAIAELAQHGDAAKLLAGGQSLVPLLNMRLATPCPPIDLNRVTALAHITLRAGGLAIGAMTRQRAVERSALAALHAPLLGEALPWVGHFQIRNRGTVGGSLSHADPAAELPAVALCLDARFTARGPAGERTLGADEFFRTQLTTALAPTEVLTEVWFPSTPRAAGSAWLELARRHGDYALVGVGAVVALAGDRIGEARLALTGVGTGRCGCGRPRRGSPASPSRRRCSATSPRRSAGRSTPGATSTRPRRIAGTSPACWRRGRSGSPSRARRKRRMPDPAPMEVRLRVNGRDYAESVPPRLLLSDFLRHRLGLTGTHVGCEHGVCGACTVLLDGEAVRSCLLLAVQVAGAEITTVEGLAEPDGRLHPVQQAFHEMHALQCGFCTPGFLLSVLDFLRDAPAPTDDEIRQGSGVTSVAAPATRTSCGPSAGPASCWRSGARPPDRRAP